MNYYELHLEALKELRSDDEGITTNGQRAIAYAILALTEQVQGLRNDLIERADLGTAHLDTKGIIGGYK